jgi:hypothetical protein
MEDDLHRERLQWKMTLMKDNLNGERAQWKTISMEALLNERQPHESMKV